MSLFLLMIKIGLINSSNFNCSVQFVSCFEFLSIITLQTFLFQWLERLGSVGLLQSQACLHSLCLIVAVTGLVSE